MVRYFLLIFSITQVVPDLGASHIKGGYITARRVDELSLTYAVTFVGYEDSRSDVVYGSGVLDFGDGTILNAAEEEISIKQTQISFEVVKVQFTVMHTYSGPASYTISYSESFRNGGIANVENSGSIPFYVQTKITIDPFLPNYYLPILQDPTTFTHGSGTKSFNQFQMKDTVEDDFITYKLVVPKLSRESNIAGHSSPVSPDFYMSFVNANSERNGPPTLYLDRFTGTLIWDSPGDIFNTSGSPCSSVDLQCSEYNIAIKATEWRILDGKLYTLSEIMIDMLLVVSNNVPEYKISTPDTLCVDEDRTFEFRIETEMEYKVSIENSKIISRVNDQPLDLFIESTFTGNMSFSLDRDVVEDTFSVSKLYFTEESNSENKRSPFATFGVIFSKGCENLYDKVGSMKGILSTMDYQSDFWRDVIVYPNPAKNVLNVQTSLNQNGIKMVIYSVQGQKIIERELSNNFTELFFEDSLVPGLYVIKFFDRKGRYLSGAKILKE